MIDADFLIRSVRESDLEDLERLSELVYFINLPSNRDLLKEKIRKSVDSFNGQIQDKFEREYIFVLVDQKSSRVIGTSMIIARHGSPDIPHMYFELKEKQKYSETIHAGFIHKVLSLKFDSDGPTEIGGLVIDPSYRGHKLKLGRILSFCRFSFMKMKRRWFKDRVLSELMPPCQKVEKACFGRLSGEDSQTFRIKMPISSHGKTRNLSRLYFPKEIFTLYFCLVRPGTPLAR